MNGIALRDITGADRGFNVGADVLTHTADGVPLARAYSDFVAALEEWNRGRDAISRLFTFDTTDAFAQLSKDPQASPDFEEASEFGQPKAARAAIDWLQMGFPLRWFDIGERYTRRFLRDVTAEQLEANHRAVFEADNRLLFRTTLSALTTKVIASSRPVTKPEGHTVYDLWDGSAGEVPQTYAGKTFDSTHSHYLVSGAANVDGGDLKQLIDTIQEHGYGLPESGEQIVLMVRKGSTIANTIRTLRTNPTDATTLAKDPYDFIPSMTAPAYLTPENIQGTQAPGTWQTLPIFGSYGDAFLFESHWIPDGYVLALATSGAGFGSQPARVPSAPQRCEPGPASRLRRWQGPVPAPEQLLRAWLRRRGSQPLGSRRHADQGLGVVRQSRLAVRTAVSGGRGPSPGRRDLRSIPPETDQCRRAEGLHSFQPRRDCARLVTSARTVGWESGQTGSAVTVQGRRRSLQSLLLPAEAKGNSMSFLNAVTSDELRAAVCESLPAQSGADQFEAECAAARRLAPTENDFLRDELSVVVHRALTSMDESHDFEGAAPVLTVSPYGYSPRSAEHTRDGAAPIARHAAHSCHQCGLASAHTTPFWLALGRHILQVDLCHRCAVDAIDRGGRAQSLSIPDAVPEDFE